MNVNPDDYDLGELRRMARERTPGDGDGDGARSGDAASAGGSSPSAERRTRPSGDGRANGRGNGSFAFDEADGRSRNREDAVRSNQLEQLFLHQSAGEDLSLQKPYLQSVPDRYAAERVVFDWLEFLVLKTGFKRSFQALRYYQDIDWITPEVEDELQEYLLGFTTEVEHVEELTVEDHQLSLVYLAQLASMA